MDDNYCESFLVWFVKRILFSTSDVYAKGAGMKMKNYLERINRANYLRSSVSRIKQLSKVSYSVVKTMVKAALDSGLAG